MYLKHKNVVGGFSGDIPSRALDTLGMYRDVEPWWGTPTELALGLAPLANPHALRALEAEHTHSSLQALHRLVARGDGTVAGYHRGHGSEI